MLASSEAVGDEAEEGEGGLEEMIAVIEEEIGISTFETDTEMREAGSASASESGTGEIQETLDCADHQLEEHDRRREMREIFETVSGIYPRD